MSQESPATEQTGQAENPLEIFSQIMELDGDPAYPVLPDMRIGIAKTLNPFDLKASDKSAPVPPYYLIDLVTREVKATAAGMLRMQGKHFIVEPLAALGNENLSVLATIFHKDYMGELLQPIVYDRALRLTGASLALDITTLKTALEAVRESGVPRPDVVLCEGRAPEHGKNGYLERLHGAREEVGRKDADGGIDYRDRGAHPYVEAGTAIARYYPPTPGKMGLDVFGKELPARDGSPKTIEVGDSVQQVAQEDGTIVYEATEKGLVDVEESTVAISRVLHIQGDVDMNSGNVAVETGSVHVHGTIRAGFTAVVAEHLVVDKGIESAMVDCGGDIKVVGGIMMEGRNLVHAGGSLFAGFTQDAVIEADGDIVIEGGITNSFLTAKGRVVAAAGKGIVQGGSVVAGQGIEILEAGSEMGVQTALTIALDIPELNALTRELEDLRGKIRRVEQWLGEGTARSLLLQTPEPDRLVVAELLRVRSRLEERMRVVQEEMKRMNAMNNHALTRAPVIIRKVAHPGTRIRIGERTIKLEQKSIATRFVWNPKEKRIETETIV